MKKLLYTALFSIFLSLVCKAQPYNNAIGLRGSFHSGITFRTFLSDERAAEFILSTRWEGVLLTGLYEVYKPVNNVPSLYWYYGVGAHVGTYGRRFPDRYRRDYWDGPSIGLDFIIGLEYVFQELPVALSLDWKPAIDIVAYPGWYDGIAFGIKLYF